MNTRRGFLATLIGAAVLDPERLLWVPGKKMISIPKQVIESPKVVAFWRIITTPTSFGFEQTISKGEKELVEALDVWLHDSSGGRIISRGGWRRIQDA